jgi:hypothetical protein
MTQRDERGRYTGGDPIRRLLDEHHERQRDRLQHLADGKPAGEIDSEVEPGPGSFDGGRRSGGLEEPESMERLLRDAAGRL